MTGAGRGERPDAVPEDAGSDADVTAPAPTDEPAATPSESAATPSEPAATQSASAATPSASDPTPSEPAATQSASASTPREPAATPREPTTTPSAELADVPEVFPPTLREVMLRPRWLAMLLLCLIVAGVFAWLGQWQLGNAIDTDPPPPGMTEELRPIEEVVEPGAYLPEPYVGQKVEVTGSWVPGDFIVVTTRFNDEVEGFWVTGQFRLADTATPTSIAVAAGWAPTREEADAAAAALETEALEGETLTLTGRIISDEGPALPPRDRPQEQVRMSPAALLGLWHDTEGLDVYRPYLTSAEPFGGLVAIASPAPKEGAPVNWLNLFYAAEWAVFAGFAFYLWYRLARDAWEKEVEDLEGSDDDDLLPKSDGDTASDPRGRAPAAARGDTADNPRGHTADNPGEHTADNPREHTADNPGGHTPDTARAAGPS